MPSTVRERFSSVRDICIPCCSYGSVPGYENESPGIQFLFFERKARTKLRQSLGVYPYRSDLKRNLINHAFPNRKHQCSFNTTLFKLNIDANTICTEY